MRTVIDINCKIADEFIKYLPQWMPEISYSILTVIDPNFQKADEFIKYLAEIARNNEFDSSKQSKSRRFY